MLQYPGTTAMTDHCVYRILLATIRNLGACPCPRCTIPKANVPELGTKYDDSRRSKFARIDDHSLQSTIKSARKAIYEGGRGVKSTAVEKMLQKESLVPTQVRKFTHLGSK